MKMKFEGWGRKVYTHDHEVRALPINHGFSIGEIDEPLEWNDHNEARGKVTNLGLGGDFCVTFKFQSKELKNWLKSYVAASPEDALRLLTKMQAEAIINLNSKNESTQSKESNA